MTFGVTSQLFSLLFFENLRSGVCSSKLTTETSFASNERILFIIIKKDSSFCILLVEFTSSVHVMILHIPPSFPSCLNNPSKPKLSPLIQPIQSTLSKVNRKIILPFLVLSYLLELSPIVVSSYFPLRFHENWFFIL